MNNYQIFFRLIVLLTSLIIFAYSSFFFLGGIEEHNLLKSILLLSILHRALGFSLLGVPSLIIIKIVALIQHNRGEKDLKFCVIEALKAYCIFFLVALFGTIIFFF